MNALLQPFDPQPAPQDGWLAEERLLASWVRSHGGEPTLCCVAAWLRRAESQGDSCLALAAPQRCGSPGWTPAEIDALRRSALVSDGSVRRPLVIDDVGRCWWWRNWRHEQRIGEVLGARLDPLPTPAGLPALIERLFAGGDPTLDAAQRAAVQRAGQRLLVLTGGPGTGKTRTALRLLLACQLLASEPLRIALAAPTGKAAQRLNESLQQGSRQLPADADIVAACTELLEQPAQTVHRLLGWSPSLRRFRHGRALPLQADVVLVDEVSMLDLATLRALCDALREHATLVLLGDAEQLSSVASGSVLDDVVQALEGMPRTPVVRLSHGFRSDAALTPALEAARRGDALAVRNAAASCPQALALHLLHDPGELAALLDDWSATLAEQVVQAAGGTGESAARQLLSAWQSRQLLCALREGRFGARSAAEHIDATLRERLGHPAGLRHWAGQAVIVQHNDYARGLFNGDLGVMAPDANGVLRAWFPAQGTTGTLRDFAPGDLPSHASAAALTVHKAQGSEYDHVALLLPPRADLELLDRQLVYTALTRARHSLEIWSSPATLEAALARRSVRLGGLRERLAEVAANNAHRRITEPTPGR